jgi:hypothetical protein
LDVKRQSTYRVYVDLGANEFQIDATFSIKISGQSILGGTFFTGGYDTPKRTLIGRLRIKKGKQRLRLRVIKMPKGFFADVHNIILQPIQQQGGISND